MLLRASSEFDDLVKAVEGSLDKLGITHIHNGTQNIAEFEIESPNYFRIVIESRSDPVISNNPILPSRITKAKGCNVDVRFDAQEANVDAVRVVGNVLREAVSILGMKPWSGFGFMESERERRKWTKLIG